MTAIIMLFVVSSVICLYTIGCNVYLVQRYDQACKERDEAINNLNKLKLLNKLKVDWYGEPIISQENME